ncbi:AAA family ATPase [Photobacterium leiognathi]|uniref:AAA family ATPase n=1 Tax=Photobacterium leiognathi TaxID=553611 RepID=UPI003BF5A88E|nr:AAA family ATPase [Photobacterium leiognathi]
MQTQLAVKMRPRKLIDILGQSHLTDEHTEFHTIVGLDKPRSLILSGPPGCGKTSMARIVAAGWSICVLFKIRFKEN